MTIVGDPPPVAGRATPFDELLPALAQLDRRLALAVARARIVFGADASSDRFRGLYITEQEVEGLLAREPGTGAFHGCLESELTEPSDAAVPGSRLDWLSRVFHLTSFDVDVLVFALAPKLDLRYERLYAFLQDDVSRRRPTLDLALTLLCESARLRAVRRVHFSADAPLVKARLLRIGSSAGTACASSPLDETLELDEQIVDFLLGHEVLDRRLSHCCRLDKHADALESEPPSALDDDTTHTLHALVTRAYHDRAPLQLLLHGAQGTGKHAVAMAVATASGAALLSVDMSRLKDAPEAEALFALALRTGWLQHAIVVVAGAELLSAEMRDTLRAYAGIVILCATSAAASTSRDELVIPFAIPPMPRRRALWEHALTRCGVRAEPTSLDAVASRFRVTSSQIDGAVAMVTRTLRWEAARANHDDGGNGERSAGHRGQPTVDAGDLFAAARAQCGLELESLASRLAPHHSWSDLVLPDDELAQLREICERVANREQVVETWGFGHRLTRGGGVNALFSGSSGTGKTMAAEVMAGALGVDLFRVDLAGVVSKYIGETEKNLDRVFSAAEHANGIIFFDEADALFGKRSEVHDSHDRYANIEISYLLQKMEQFDGVAILATNLRGNLDEAFVRRLAFSIHFPLPDAAHRERIWRGIWPSSAPVDPKLDMSTLARMFALSGGHIKNIALAAAFLAAERGACVEMRDIVHATRREYQKLGKTLTATELGPLATHLS